MSNKHDGPSVGQFWKTIGLVGIAGPAIAALIAGVFSVVVYQRGQVQLGPFSVQRQSAAQTTPSPAPTPSPSPVQTTVDTSLGLQGQQCQQGDVRFAGRLLFYPTSTNYRDVDNACLPAAAPSLLDLQVSYDAAAIQSYLNAGIALWPSPTPPSREDCAKTIVQGGLGSVSLTPSLTFCLQTMESRIAVGHVTKRTSTEIEMEFVVWEMKLRP